MENAAKTQFWTAVAVHVLAAIVKIEVHLEAPLYSLLQILSVTAIEKFLCNKLSSTTPSPQSTPSIPTN